LYDNLWADYNLNAAKTNHAVPASVAPSQSGTSNLLSAKKKFPLRFMDQADRCGLGQIALPYVGWGCEFVDLDADGWLDLVVANGNTLEEPGTKILKAQENFLFWNRRGEGFFNIAPLNTALSELHSNRGMAIADYDRDGDMDMVFAQLGEGVQLLRNDIAAGRWLQLKLRSRWADGRPIGFGDGAKVIVHVADAVMRRTVSSASYLSQSSRTLHFGLGKAVRADRIEVRWLGGGTNVFENVEANAIWELIENEPAPKCLPHAIGALARKPVDDASTVAAAPLNAKAQIVEFWKRQRAAMDTMKVKKDFGTAAGLFRQALELNPAHEDSRYYLSHCLAVEGDIAGALQQLETLTTINPQSHRGFQQWGRLRARYARSAEDLTSAEQALDRAHALNPEETGALLVLGEISLLRGEHAKAAERLAAACRTNPRATGGLFLRAYLAWQNGRVTEAESLLEEARASLGKDWQPKGATAEGDVKNKQHEEGTPLTRFWESWNGETAPEPAFAALKQHLAKNSASLSQ
ncbi:MAG: ASPIC/UnbV domain-containing protein, partial [Verrucomicrobiota bacterium]